MILGFSDCELDIERRELRPAKSRSVGKDGDRVRIPAQLNDVTTGSHIWAEHRTRALS
jgi:TolB-like protein